MPFFPPAVFAGCLRPSVFFCPFWSAEVRDKGLGVAAAVGVDSCVGEVSSGKVMLHVMSLETKKFSLAGRSSQAYNTNVLHPKQTSALLRRWDRTGIIASKDSITKARHNPITPIT